MADLRTPKSAGDPQMCVLAVVSEQGQKWPDSFGFLFVGGFFYAGFGLARSFLGHCGGGGGSKIWEAVCYFSLGA